MQNYDKLINIFVFKSNFLQAKLGITNIKMRIE